MQKSEVEEVVIQASTIQKEDMVSAFCKSQECNIKVSGVHYRYKDWNKKNSKGRNKWRNDMIRRILVDTGVAEEDVLFEKRNGKMVLREVIRDMHPLAQKEKSASIGPTIIIAFTQSMLANDIK